MERLRSVGIGTIALGGFLLALAVAQVASRAWVGDFWAHAAVVRALSRDLLDPAHPQLVVDVPHAFFSPYHLLVGTVARLLGTDAIPTLAAFSFPNLIVWVYGVRRFCGALADTVAPAATAWTLLAVLFLWGPGGWFWSGFFHFEVFPYALPYPSTLAMGLQLLGAVAWYRGDPGRPSAWILRTLLIAFLVLTHPLTAVVHVGLAAALVWHRSGSMRSLGRVALCSLAGFGVASAWPWYPLLGLFRTETAEFHTVSRDLYDHVLRRTWPLLLGLPVLFSRWRAHPRDALVLAAGGFASLYLLGAVTQTWGMGRVVSAAAFCLQAAVGIALARAPGRAGILARVVAVAFLAWAIAESTLSIRTFTRRTDRVAPYEPIARRIGPDDVVLAPLHHAWRLPALTGKVVAVENPMYWVDDIAARRDAVRRALVSPAVLDSVVEAHGVRWSVTDSGDSLQLRELR